MPKTKEYVKGSFGELLSSLISRAGLTKTAFYEQMNITKTYLFDVLNGRVPPPTPDMQIRMICLLNLNEQDQILFFELAAEKRNEVPVDIAWYLRDKKSRKEIREKIDYTKFIKSGGQ